MNLFNRLFENDEHLRNLERRLSTSPDDVVAIEKYIKGLERSGSLPELVAAKVKFGKMRNRRTIARSSDKPLHPSQLRQLERAYSPSVQYSTRLWGGRIIPFVHRYTKLKNAASRERNPLKRSILDTLAKRTLAHERDLASRQRNSRVNLALDDKRQARNKLRTLQLSKKLGATTPAEGRALMRQYGIDTNVERG